jgi:hypothetical protein
MTIDEFQNHDCCLSQEDGCTCTNVEIDEERDEHEITDDELENENDHLEELDNECIPDHSRDE